MKSTEQHGEAGIASVSSDGRVTLEPQRLKALRLQRGLSQEALATHCFAQRLCVSIASIKRAESGRPVLYRTARHLAQAYGVPLEGMLAGAPASPLSAGQEARDGASAEPQEAQDAAFAGGDGAALRSVVVLTIPSAGGAADLAEAMRLVAQFGGLPVSAPQAWLQAVFGLPRAFCSDAERCVECAVALRRRLGAACGGIVVRQGEWADGALWWPTGTRPAPPVHGPGVRLPDILVEQTCAALLWDEFDFGTLVQEGAGASYRVVETGAAEAAGRPRRPLIGRYAQLQQFKVILDAAREMQCGHVVHVRGVAGIGKSRLVREFADIARQWGFACHESGALDFGAEAAVSPWRRIARGLVGCPEFEGPGVAGAAQDAAAWSEGLLRIGLEREQAAPLQVLLGLPQTSEQALVLAGMEHGERRRCTVEALRTMILHAAMTQPLVLILEDLHWADKSFLDVFALLLPLVSGAAITWVLSSRIDGDPLDARLRASCEDQPLTVFDLGPLRRAEAEGLALQCGLGDEDYRSQCVERAAGNALFLTQLLMSPQGPLPDSLRHLVQSQIDRLEPQDRRALRIASAMGQQFPLPLLREMLGDPGYRTDGPERANLFKSPAGECGAFVHALVMDCIYESTAPAWRRHIHAQLAGFYRERDAVLWARHLGRAGDAQAVAAYLQAIRGQMAQHGYESATELVAQCRLLDMCASDGHALEMLAAEAAMRTMRNPEALASYGRARSLAVTPQQRIDAALGMAAVLNVLDRTEEEEALLDGLHAETALHGSQASQARLLYLKGNIYFPRGDFSASRQLHGQALRHARLGGDRALEALALSGLGDSLYAQGRMVEAHAVFADCLDLCEAHGLVSIKASNRFMRGTARIYLGRTAEALDDALSSADLGHRVGNRRAEIVSRLTAGWVLLSMAHLDDAQAQVEEGLAIARSMGAARFEPFLTESLARIRFAQGQPDRALCLIREACEGVQRLHLQRFIGPWLMGTLALLSDDAQERSQALSRGEEMLAAGCVAHNHFRFHVAAAEVALLLGDGAGAVAQAGRLRALAGEEGPCPWVEHHARTVAACARWLEVPGEDNREVLRTLRRQADEGGMALVMPRLDALLREG
ncbi:AAA family ATPase [Acidovorax sp. NCPPB 2350]|nr:AAA family ATPase [Acidovorax sp. NCPPB 2350]